jgi:hypothetical protein
MNAAWIVLRESWPVIVTVFGLVGILCAADRHDTKGDR